MNQEVKIVEKVKFWEKQDKINQVLIPRVLDIHEQLKSTSLLSQKNSSDYVQVKSSLLKLDKEIDEFLTSLNDIEKKFEQLSKGVKLDIQKQQSGNADLSRLCNESITNIQKSFSRVSGELKSDIKTYKDDNTKLFNNTILSIEDRLNKASKEIRAEIKKQKDDNTSLKNLFDITMQDIDTRYKGLIVSITELREFINERNSEHKILRYKTFLRIVNIYLIKLILFLMVMKVIKQDIKTYLKN